MKLNFCVLSIIPTIFILVVSQTVNAQIGNFTLSKLIEEKFTVGHLLGNPPSPYKGIPTVHVNYESPTTILISGDLINTDTSRFNSNIWEAMDLIKTQYGFKLQDVMTSGIGSVGNPTTVYILMTK